MNQSALAGTVAALVCLSTAAFAADGGEGAGGLEVVVVTAQKRAESVQQVPVAVNVVGGDALIDRNIVETRELVHLAPSLTISGSDNASYGQGFQIRGIGTQVNSPTLAQSVAVVLDGISLANAAMGRMDFSDIERIEVLKGPQGMLFGRNASAGLISIVTRRPVLGQYEASAHLSYGAADGFNDALAQVMGNVPLGETTALRLNAYYHDRGGYITNLLDGKEMNGYTDRGIRAKLLWEPTNDLTVNFSADYSKQYDPYRVNPAVSLRTGNLTAQDIQVQQSLAAYGIVPRVRNTEALVNATSYGGSDAGGAILRVDWELGDYVLTSTSGYRKYTINELQKDNDGTVLPTFDINRQAGPFTQYSQELQLTSPSDRTFEYVAGLFYDSVKVDQTNNFGGALPQNFCVGPIPQTNPPGVFCVEQWHYTYRTSSMAAYGQGTIHFTDRLRMIAGGRLTYDDNSFDYRSYTAPGYDNAATFFPVPVPAFHQSINETNFSWRVGPQFEITPDVMVYATASTGYKAPGFDSVGPCVQETRGAAPTTNCTNANAVVDAETSKSYEIGLKSTWFDGRLMFNLDAFYTKFEDFQTQTTVFDSNGVFVAFRVQNAGELLTKGFGAELMAAPLEGLNLSANVAYTDAYFTDYRGAGCYTTQPLLPAPHGCNPSPRFTDNTGNPLPNSPKWIYTLGARYEHALSDRVVAFASADWYHRSSTNFSAALDPLLALPGYGLLGASVGVQADDGRWKVSLSGKNLLDEPFMISLVRSGVFTPGLQSTGYFTQEAFRTIYLNVDFKL